MSTCEAVAKLFFEQDVFLMQMESLFRMTTSEAVSWLFSYVVDILKHKPLFLMRASEADCCWLISDQEVLKQILTRMMTSDAVTWMFS